MDKICMRCKVTKPTEEFGKRSDVKDGLAYTCKECNKEYSRKYREANPKKRKATTKRYREANKEKTAISGKKYVEANKEEIYIKAKKYRENNPEKRKATLKKYTQNNREKLKVRYKKWKQDNREKVNATNAKRRAAKLNAIVPWANDFFIEEIYAHSQLFTKMFDVPYVVDHIVPLQHPLVCGLHCEDNLQVITARANGEKLNTFIV